ncbi:MAG: DUF2752 domain-containing protein [Candidatus Magnetominusculus sp. LBB02]|nr:DUF2752 domain-containing protein [Candidatus Magnetominusculus sp. LBB02]
MLSSFKQIIAAVALVVGTVIVYTHDPSVSRFYPKCVFHELTGLYCPGCGSTRAVYQLLHGNIAAAFRFNPFVVLTLPFIIYCILAEFGAFAQFSSRYGWTFPAAIAIFWILRNIPIEMFACLRP